MKKFIFAVCLGCSFGVPGTASAIDLDPGNSVCFIHTRSQDMMCWTQRPNQGPTITQVERVNGTDYWIRHFNLDGSSSSWFGGWARVRELLVGHPNYR